MLIALDYDGTYTADPELWDRFIDTCMVRGHKVYVITMRYENSECQGVIKDLGHKVEEIIFTERKAKMLFMSTKRPEIKIDVWIDDNPHWIFKDG